LALGGVLSLARLIPLWLPLLVLPRDVVAPGVDADSAEWAVLLHPVLDDPTPFVALAAIDALASIDLASLGPVLSACPRTRWILAHFRSFIAWLLYEPKSVLGIFAERHRRDPREVLPLPTLAELCAEVLDMLTNEAVDTMLIEGVPSLLEELLEALDEPAAEHASGALSVPSLMRRARSAPLPLREVLCRVLVGRHAGELERELEPRLISAANGNSFSQPRPFQRSAAETSPGVSFQSGSAALKSTIAGQGEPISCGGSPGRLNERPWGTRLSSRI
jgi:hypothetical protein